VDCSNVTFTFTFTFTFTSCPCLSLMNPHLEVAEVK
jgi:hypothetical protein